MSTAEDDSDDAALARLCADRAGLALTEGRTGEGPEAGRRGDALAQQVIMDLLRAARPHDRMLSEEAADDPARLGAGRVWIVDPLDGTREYSEPGRPDWAVHVALWERGQGERGQGEGDDGRERGRLTAGAVALPARGCTLGTDRPPIVPPARPGRLRITVSRTRPPSFVATLADALDAELVPLGSAGYKVAAVLLGEADAYVHAGGQYEWDSAAPVAVARSAGLHASRTDGAELVYNTPDPRVPDLLVCRPELAADLLGRIAAAIPATAGATR